MATDSDWDKVIKRSEEVCAVCQEALLADGEVLTALALGADGFFRKDHHPDCFDNSDTEAFSTWRWKRARELRPNPRRLDLGFLSEFFRRLDGKDEDQSRRVAWIVSLLLLRKKILEEVGRKTVDNREVLELRFRKTERVYDVPDPQLDAEAMSSIEDDLSRIFNLDAPQVAPDAEVEGGSDD